MSARKVQNTGALHHLTVEARQTRLSLSPDSVIIHKNGIEFLQQLRSDGDKTPFGFVTTEVSQEMRTLAESSGAAFLIGKPFTPEDFQRALENYLD